ncbi:hypothetical protein Ddye_023710 [Dipteronia dyeriana]|uniref:Retrotransposon Copia-like N-terminal domain-containing protein n=1 Tax=Dipteronia dyeriana TaxID=168575 RepID=A0AAD9TTG0_9ROSI|nr:hypothetical protein Ddye_023710 [Dipteronia dyeriana]
MDFSSLAKTLSLNLTLKLDHSNYFYWKTQVLTAIEALGLKGMVNETKRAPSKFLLIHYGDDSEQEENLKYVNWKKKDKLFMSWIFSTLTTSVLGQINGSKSSFEIWSKIEKTYS